MENHTYGVMRETNPRTAKGEYCPNDGGPLALRYLRRVKRKLPILGTALRPGRPSHRPTSSYLIVSRYKTGPLRIDLLNFRSRSR
jgi:hypothetical protein